MRLQRLSVTGFGKLVGQEYSLGAGLNVIYGPNESGKSTLQTFIRAMLYGLKTPDAKSRRWRPERALYKPWLDAPYGGALEFMAADNRLYRVERSFTSDRIKVYDLVTGADLTERFPLDGRKEYLFAEYFTGMNELVFTNTACIGDIPDAGSEKGRRELAARLANLRESGDEATSVRRATDLLEAARRTLVTQANVASRAQNGAQAAWDAICAEHEAIRLLELTLSELQQQRHACQQQLDTATRHLLAYRLVSLRNKVEQAQRLMARLDHLKTEIVESERLAAFPIHLVDQVKILANQLATQDASCSTLQEKQQRARQRMMMIQTELARLPGAALVTEWVEEPQRIEQTQRVIERFTELVDRTRSGAQRLEAAQVACIAAQKAEQRYATLVDLPPYTPQLLTELGAVNNEAGLLKEQLLSINQRRRQLTERFGQYQQQVSAVTETLHRLERFTGVPVEHREEFEAQVSACVTLAQSLPRLQADINSLRTEETTLLQAQQLIQATKARLERPKEQSVGSDKDEVRPMGPQLRAAQQVCDRLLRASTQVRQAELGLAALPDLTADEEALAHQVERENPLWQAAEQQLSGGTQELVELREEERLLDAQIDTLNLVAQAGAMGLAKAEHLHSEEQEARKQIEAATQAANQVAIPPIGKQVLGGILVIAGVMIALGFFWFTLPLATLFPALLLLLCGGYLFQQNYRIRHERKKQREMWYEHKRNELATTERLCGQLRSLLSQAGQTSVTAWQVAWQQLTQLQNELAEVLRKQQIIESQLQQAKDQILTAQRNASSLMQTTGIELEHECTAAQAAAALAVLQARLAKRVRLQQEYQTVLATLDAERETLAQEERSLAQQLLHVTQQLAQLRNRQNEQLAQLSEAVTWVMRHLSPATGFVPNMDQLQAGSLPWEKTAITNYINEFMRYLNTCERAEGLAQELDALGMQCVSWHTELTSVMRRGQTLQERWRSCVEATDKSPAALPEAAVSMVSWTIANPAWEQQAILQRTGLQTCDTTQGEQQIAPLTKLLSLKATEQPWSVLIGTPDLTPWVLTMDELMTVTQEISDAILTHAQVKDPESLVALWQGWEEYRQLLQERRINRDHSRQAYVEERQLLQQLLEQQVESLCEALTIVTPERQLTTASDLTQLTTVLEQWQPVINEVSMRLQTLAETYAAWQAEEMEEATLAAQYAEEQRMRDEMQTELASMLQQGEAQSIEEFMTSAADYNHRQQLISDAQATQRELQAHLGDKTLESYMHELAETQQAWERLADVDTADLFDYLHTQTESYWRAQYQRLEDEMTALRDKQVQLEAELSTHRQRCANEAAVNGELHNTLMEKERSARALAAVQLAQQQLNEAIEEVRRQFTPALNAQASALLSQMTEQRYQQVAVSDTLDIKLTDAQFARQVDLNTLSKGTSEQVYLAFRLACVQVIAGERWHVPIILDDAFAHYDDVRAQQAIEVLLKLVDQADAQILFFTCRSREWYYLKHKAAQLKKPCNLIQLM
jgi:DNA repair exonuclease SbcCD ATPase subunit